MEEKESEGCACVFSPAATNKVDSIVNAQLMDWSNEIQETVLQNIAAFFF